MKFTLLLFLITTAQVFGTVYSQATKLSINLQNVSIVDILGKIEDQSEFKFLYNNDLLDKKRDLKVNYNNKTVYEILDHVLTGTGSTYSVLENNLIVITPSGEAVARQGQVTGKVISTDGEPLVGATVVQKGTTKGTVTDIDGNFSLNVASDDAVLVVSFVGYLSKEVPLNGQTNVTVSLNENIVGLDEVVVVGYGSIKKSDLTGSLSQVKSEEISAYPSAGLIQALQGRAAGVQISSNNGEPGAGVKIRIRGGTSINSSSEPLFVVDGFPGGTLPPPEDIESIEILKDASATAIYGSRGANGVIMVATKRGTAGKTRIEFNTSYSIQKEINRFDLLNAAQMAEYVNESRINIGVEPSKVPYPNPSYGVGTDWQEEILQTGGIQNYQLSLSGGNENVRYYVSGVVYDQKGLIINSGYKRYSVTSNIDISTSGKFNFGAFLFASRTNKNGVKTQESSSGPTGSGVISSAFRFEPTQSVYDENGNYTIATLNDTHDNPVALANELVNEDLADRLQANFFGEYAILPELKFKMTLGANIYNSRNGDYTPTTLNAAKNRGGIGGINSSKNTNLISENYLTYAKTFGVQDLSVMAGYSYQSFENSGWTARAAGFITDAGLYWNLGQGAELQTPSSGISFSELSSYYGRINYKLHDRYIFTVTARYDGSSRFAKNNKWAFFPSGAFAWNAAEEPFMQDVNQIDQMKFRASYGVTGNQAISPYQSLAKFGSVLTIIDGNIVNAVRPTTVANDNLTWESTVQTNIGIDLGLLGMRLLFNADYYRMVTSDLLFSQPLPQYSGYGSLLSNIGKVENKGFEMSVTSRNIDGKLKWDTEFNISTNRNKVLELPEGKDIFYNSGPGHMVGLGNTGVLREGAPVGSFYGYTYEGVLQSDSEALPGNPEQNAGGEKFKDISGFDAEGNQDYMPDGTISSADRDIIGNPHPDFIWGLNNTLTYKGFDLNIFFQGSQGNELYSFSLMELDLMAGQNNATTAALNRWTPSNTNTDIPAARPRARISSTRWVYDGSYVRLKNIALGYNFNKEMISRYGISSLRFYASAQNLITITNYPGFDPEVNWRTDGNTNSNRNLGLDYGSYPNAKSITFGMQVSF